MSAPDAKDACKWTLDLWMHQNALMWSRLQVLWFVQIGFLALAGYLFTPRSAIPGLPQASLDAATLSSLAKWVSLLCAVTTFGLWIVMRTDRLIRNIYRRNLEALDVGLFPASLGQIRMSKDKGARFVEPTFVYTVFAVFVGIDLYAASVFGLERRACLGVGGFFLLVSVMLPVVESFLPSSTRSV